MYRLRTAGLVSWLAAFAIFLWWVLDPTTVAGVVSRPLFDRGVNVGKEHFDLVSDHLGGLIAVLAILLGGSLFVTMFGTIGQFPFTRSTDDFRDEPPFRKPFFANIVLFVGVIVLMAVVNTEGLGEHDRRIVDSVWTRANRIEIDGTAISLNCGVDRVGAATEVPSNLTDPFYKKLYDPSRRLSVVGTCLDAGDYIDDLRDGFDRRVWWKSGAVIALFLIGTGLMLLGFKHEKA